MNPTLQGWLQGIGIPAIGVLLTYLALRRNNRQDRAADREATIDDLREDLRALGEEMADHKRVINSQADYIEQLRAHISDGKPPPPPPWPDGMRLA